MRDKINELICRRGFCAGGPNALSEPLTLCDDLAMDSLDLVELTMDLEELIEEEISDIEAESWETVGDIYTTVNKLRNTTSL